MNQGVADVGFPFTGIAENCYIMVINQNKKKYKEP
jgi:hypothetical protein